MECPECGQQMILSMAVGGYEVWACPYCYHEEGLDICDAMSYTEVAMMHEGERDE